MEKVKAGARNAVQNRNMSKVKTIKKGVEERNAYCNEPACGWSSHKLNSNILARSHTRMTGHTVDIYTETRSRSKKI